MSKPNTKLQTTSTTNPPQATGLYWHYWEPWGQWRIVFVEDGYFRVSKQGLYKIEIGMLWGPKIPDPPDNP